MGDFRGFPEAMAGEFVKAFRIIRREVRDSRWACGGENPNCRLTTVLPRALNVARLAESVVCVPNLNDSVPLFQKLDQLQYLVSKTGEK
jgi:hypothetical protein